MTVANVDASSLKSNAIFVLLANRRPPSFQSDYGRVLLWTFVFSSGVSGYSCDD